MFNVNVWGKHISNIKNNTKINLQASKAASLEVNVDEVNTWAYCKVSQIIV